MPPITEKHYGLCLGSQYKQDRNAKTKGGGGLFFLSIQTNAVYHVRRKYRHFLDCLIDINYTVSLEIVDNFYTNLLRKYHWVSVNSLWPSGRRPSLCDVHNSLNTDPLLLLGVGGQANSVKSKIISSPINNQLQDCYLSDRAEKPKKVAVWSGREVRASSRFERLLWTISITRRPHCISINSNDKCTVLFRDSLICSECSAHDILVQNSNVFVAMRI